MSHFKQALSGNGFDSSVSPPWQMIPESGFKRVELTDAAGLDVVSMDTKIATVEEAPSSKVSDTDRAIIINAKSLGTTFIEARKGSTVAARLEITVKPRLRFSIAFHFVEDSAKHKTKRGPGNPASMVEVMNKLYLPQANISFSVQSATPLSISQDLGAIIPFSTEITFAKNQQGALVGTDDTSKMLATIFSKRNNSADFNVFFVWKIGSNIEGYTLMNNCLFQDLIKVSDALKLAHEAGHFLLWRAKDSKWFDHTTGKSDLMAEELLYQNVLLLKKHVNAMNP